MKYEYKLEDLEVYKMASEFSDRIWNLVVKWDFFAKDTIGKQFVRSADSISANIAEGYGRFSYKENIQFCFYSRGSLLETKNWLLKSKSRKLISDDVFENLIELLDHLHRKMNAYIKFLKSKVSK